MQNIKDIYIKILDISNYIMYNYYIKLFNNYNYN